MDNDKFQYILRKSLTSNQDILFEKVMDVLKPVGKVPVIGNSYFFMYRSNKTHDRYPLVTVYSLGDDYFRGYSHHWNRVTQYNYGSLLSNLYLVNDYELENAIRFPVMKVVN